MTIREEIEKMVMGINFQTVEIGVGGRVVLEDGRGLVLKIVDQALQSHLRESFRPVLSRFYFAICDELAKEDDDKLFNKGEIEDLLYHVKEKLDTELKGLGGDESD